MVVLQNLERRMVVYNLDHKSLRKKRRFPAVTVLRNGQSVGETKTMLLPDSLTLLAKEIRGGLPDAVLECSEINAALKSSPPRLRVVERK